MFICTSVFYAPPHKTLGKPRQVVCLHTQFTVCVNNVNLSMGVLLFFTLYPELHLILCLFGARISGVLFKSIYIKNPYPFHSTKLPKEDVVNLQPKSLFCGPQNAFSFHCYILVA